MSPKVKTHRAVISRTSFSNKANLEEVKAHMKAVRATGKLVISISQGGVNTVVFEAENPLNGHDNIELLFDKSRLPIDL